MTSLKKRPLALVIEALTVGGAERMLVSLANLLSLGGEQVHVICLSEAGALAEDLDSTVQLHVLGKQAGFDWRCGLRLHGLLKQLNPRVINSHLWTANTWARACAPAIGARLVVTEHSRDSWKPSHYRLIDRLLQYRTTKLVAVSNDTAAFYRDVGIRADKIAVINNGIDTAHYFSADAITRQQLSLPKDGVLIGIVGRLVAAKNHIRLLDACALLRQQFKDFHLAIVGDGPERQSIEARIAELEAGEWVTLLGNRDDVAAILPTLDIFVLSSNREGHPLTALEAQTSGTPVVMTDVGGCADALALQDNQTGGRLVEANPEALSQALLELASDPQLRQQMGSFAAEFAREHFDQSKMVANYLKLFDGK